MSKQIKKCAYYDYMLCKTFLHTLVFEDASSPLFLTYCRIDIFRVLRQSFCGKFQIVCGFWNPANPAFRMYENLTMVSNHSIVRPMVKNHPKPLKSIVAWPKNDKKQLISMVAPNHSIQWLCCPEQSLNFCKGTKNWAKVKQSSVKLWTIIDNG